MKLNIKILFLLSIFLIGCSASSVSLRENQFGNEIKPLMEKTPGEEKIRISVPIYKF